MQEPEIASQLRHLVSESGFNECVGSNDKLDVRLSADMLYLQSPSYSDRCTKHVAASRKQPHARGYIMRLSSVQSSFHSCNPKQHVSTLVTADRS